MAEMAIIDAAEGNRPPAARGAIGKDVKVAVIALLLFEAIAWAHNWLGHPVFVAT